MLVTHNPGFILEMTAISMGALGTKINSIRRLLFIFSTLIVYCTTGKGKEGGVTCISQRDQTDGILEFEHLAFRETRKSFFLSISLNSDSER